MSMVLLYVSHASLRSVLYVYGNVVCVTPSLRSVTLCLWYMLYVSRQVFVLKLWSDTWYMLYVSHQVFSSEDFV